MAVATTEAQIIQLFKYIDKNKNRTWMPNIGTLHRELLQIFNKNQGKLTGGDKTATVYVKPALTALFATASVEMWHRSIHSLLISCSVSKTSPIWASVAGYYSSHYTVRAFSHLFGYYTLFKKGCMQVRLDGKFSCELAKKKPKTEHQEYWGYLKKMKPFLEDPVFSENNIMNISVDDRRENGHDAYHRGKANYVDHVNNFVNFTPLSEDYLITRISYIAESITETPSLPNEFKYPDLDAVQLIAYARLITFRRFMDTILLSKINSNFWAYQRNPEWCSKYINYQAPELRDLDLVSQIQK